MTEYEGTLQIENDDFGMKKKLTSNRFGGTFGTLPFDEKSFDITLIDFTTFWYSKPINANYADSPRVYTNEEYKKSSEIENIHSKCDVIDGSVVNGLGQRILYSFLLDEPPGYRVFSQPETIHYKITKQFCFK